MTLVVNKYREPYDLRRNRMSSTVIIGGQEFSAKCPTNCPGKAGFPDQGGLCHRCPILNCVGPEDTILLRPQDYRKDWAKAWREWFDRGMKGWPDLSF